MKNVLNLILILVLLFSCTRKKQDQEQAADLPEEEISNVILEEVWATDTLLRVPESVRYDEKRNVIYVSNIEGDPRGQDGEGFISKLSPEGEILELRWIDGLNAPKGMDIHEGFLYVTDITEMAVIDIEESRVVQLYEVPTASFLNDVTVEDDGLVYISDSDTDKIYLLRNGVIETWLEKGDLLSGPNGLYWEEGKIMLASSGHEQFKEISLPSKEIKIVASDIGHGDGVAKDARGNYVVSSWLGQVFYIYNDGRKIELLDTREQSINSADLDIIEDEDLVLVPTFFDNRVVAYRLKYQ